VHVASPTVTTDRAIRRLIGVYDADGTLRGELGYWIAARFGRAHCALCDITHGSVRQKPEWRDCVATFPVPFDTFHRDDQPDDVRAATGDRTPVVVAETAMGLVVLLSGVALDACAGSIEAFSAALERSVTEHGLTLERV
jgi:hypothetical protein